MKKDTPLIGGVHVGQDGYYYVVFGQENLEESADKIVYRIVKFDKSWERIENLDIKNVYVTRPFDASNLSIDSNKGKLVIHSARQRYMTPKDGLRHQSNITFHIDLENFKLLYKGGEWPRNHVGHSFSTYVRLDGNRIIYADHGDAYPRSIILQVEQNDTIIRKVELLKFPGKIGDNYTGAHLGGLEVAADNYLLVGSSVSLTEQYGKSKAKNLFLGVVPKDTNTKKRKDLKWLTNHAVNSDVEIIETHIVKMNQNKFVLLWTEQSNQSKQLFYAVVDGDGELLKEPTTLGGVPSPGNLQPLVHDNTIIWYFKDRSGQDGIEFFKLQVDEGEASK